MPKISVVDACFPAGRQESQGLAALWLHHKCAEVGLPTCKIDDADIVLVTCVAPQQYTVVETLRKKYKDKAIIVGGAASTSPAIFQKSCDAVVVGDGSRFVEVLGAQGLEVALQLDNVWDGKRCEVQIDHGFPWQTPPIQAEDGAYRVWCGRGCKKKCYFCQTGWAYKYSENPDPKHLQKQIASLLGQGKKVAYLSNDPMQHSFFDKLPAVEHGSFSLQYLRENGVPPARQIRMGVEGVSERLRSFVNKPISFDDLVKSAVWLNDNKKSVRWFMIGGLPGEKQEDWEELKKAVLEWKRFSKKGVLALSFTAWCPDPASPLAPYPISDDYFEHWLDFKEWFFGGIGFSNRVKLMQPQAPDSRMKKAMASMCLSEKELRAGGSWGPNDALAYPYKDQAKKVYARLQSDF